MKLIIEGTPDEIEAIFPMKSGRKAEIRFIPHNTSIGTKMFTLLENIKSLCKERGISLAELEKACGIAQRTIYRWDTSTPSVDKVKAVADHFKVPIDELLSDERR